MPDTFVTDKATDQVSIPCLTHLNGNHYNTEDVMLGYTCYIKHTTKMSLLAKRKDLYHQKHASAIYLSKYHPAAATIESIPSSHELSVTLSKHKLANFHIRKWNCT